MTSRSMWTTYSYLWVTLAFFLFSLLGHWLFPGSRTWTVRSPGMDTDGSAALW